MKTAQIVIAAVLGLALAGGGFAAGMTVAKGQTESASPSPSGADRGRFGAGGATGATGARGAFGQAGQQLLTGRVISVNDGSITIEVRQPAQQGASPAVTSQIVLTGTNTRVVRTAETEIKTGDLKPNDQIQIVATTDASGAVSATAIVVGGNALQQLFGGQGGSGGRGAGTPSPSPTR